jgi:hypothetical protein
VIGFDLFFSPNYLVIMMVALGDEYDSQADTFFSCTEKYRPPHNFFRVLRFASKPGKRPGKLLYDMKMCKLSIEV